MKYKNMQKNILLSLAALAVMVIAGCSKDSGTGIVTTTDPFSFKTGDYTVYQNDSLNQQGAVMANTTFRSSRTVIRTGITLGGQSDAALVVDTTFVGTTSKVASVDSSYYRVASNEVFSYFDAGRVADILGGFGAVSGLTPRWIKVAELNTAAGTADFSTDITNLSTSISGIPLTGTVKIAGRNQGAVDASYNNQTYRVYRQSQTSTGIISVAGITITVPIAAEYDYGAVSGASNSPRTILRTQVNAFSISIPLLGGISQNGYRGIITSFRAGQ